MQNDNWTAVHGVSDGLNVVAILNKISYFQNFQSFILALFMCTIQNNTF